MLKIKKFYSNKKVFITGHTGFKGSWLVSVLQEFGSKVTGYSLNDEKKIAISENMPVFTINTKEISYLPQSTSDLLSNESSIVVQESQSGGGSPNYRGMEANRLLLVVDGSQLNNAIYRSGHIQSASTINPFFLQSVKLVSGPASVIYGNGAMGGGIVFKTLSPFGSNSLDFLQQ